jgi:hypothetical protein
MLDNLISFFSEFTNPTIWFYFLAFLSATALVEALGDEGKDKYALSEKFLNYFMVISSLVTIAIASGSDTAEALSDEWSRYYRGSMSGAGFIAWCVGLFGGLTAMNLVLTYITIPLVSLILNLHKKINKL